MGWRGDRDDVWLKLARPITMLSRRAVIVLCLVFCSLLVLLVTSHRLGEWPLNGHNYKHPWKSTSPDHSSSASKSDPDRKGGSNASNPPPPAVSDLPFRPHDPICDSFPDTSKILLVMKTGATESFNRVPTQLMTVLKCLPEYFIFSDLAQTIGGYHIRDSLDTVLEEAKEGNKDFDLYRRQQLCAIDQERCNKELSEDTKEGWNLDKYKNIHIAEKTYNLRPNYDWYVFVDADTYVLWHTLTQWLSHLDPTKKHYLGSVTMIGGYGFGHGGSGYVVSQAALKEMVADHPGIGNKFDMQIQHECCGDYMFARALDNTTETRVRQVWPTINGEKPFTLPFGPSHWCHPIVTMHHMNSEEISSFWEYESQRYATLVAEDPTATPPALRMKDIYDHFVRPRLRDVREDWDNISDDTYYLKETPGGRFFTDSEKHRAKKDNLTAAEEKAHESFDACRAACEDVPQCFQFRWQNGLCGTSRAFKLGHPMKKVDNEDRRFKSGWMTQRIKEFIEEQGDCGEVKWPAVPKPS